MSNGQNGTTSFPMFLSGIKGYKWVLSWQLLLLTFFFFYFMPFQLDILTCLGFDSSGYSESVKGQIVFQRVRTPFTHLLWTLFLPVVEGACFLNSFPILACFSSAMFTLWVFGIWSYKDKKEEFTFARYAFDNCYFISIDLLRAVGRANGDEKATLK